MTVTQLTETDCAHITQSGKTMIERGHRYTEILYKNGVQKPPDLPDMRLTNGNVSIQVLERFLIVTVY